MHAAQTARDLLLLLLLLLSVSVSAAAWELCVLSILTPEGSPMPELEEALSALWLLLTSLTGRAVPAGLLLLLLLLPLLSRASMHLDSSWPSMTLICDSRSWGLYVWPVVCLQVAAHLAVAGLAACPCGCRGQGCRQEKEEAWV